LTGSGLVRAFDILQINGFHNSLFVAECRHRIY